MMEEVVLRRWLFALAVVASLAACGGDEAERLFPPIDDRDAGAGARDASDETDDASVEDAPEDDGAAIACKAASDCPEADACLLPVCVGGFCDIVFAPPGTEPPADMQVAGDCKRLECGEMGSIVARTDVNDTPPADDCIRTFCDGPNPRVENLAAGTPCKGSGVCNGKGECGVCVPGSKACEGEVPFHCDENGVWKAGPTCPSACEDGACVDD